MLRYCYIHKEYHDLTEHFDTDCRYVTNDGIIFNKKDGTLGIITKEDIERVGLTFKPLPNHLPPHVDTI
jgi:hypothetical protein